MTHGADTPGAPVLVLLVEDEPLVRMVAEDALTGAGYRVIEAADADEALTLLDRHPDVKAVVTDVKMPSSINGIELARVVSERWPRVVILVVSGHMRPDEADLPNGAQFVAKPYWPSTLPKVVDSLIAQRAG